MSLSALLQPGPMVLPGFNSTDSTAQKHLVVQQQQSVGFPVLLFMCPRINFLVCDLPYPHRITIAPQPKAIPKHDLNVDSPHVSYVEASC